jgi:ABC-type multidrug transport system ATPase subunit
MVLELRGWTIQRDRQVHIGPLDFCLNPGEIVTLMGPSGCGKSTWLMALLGYEEQNLVTSGERFQYGNSLAPGSVPAHALYIPQNLPFNPNWELQGFLCRLPWGNPTLIDTLFPMQRKRVRQVRSVLRQLGLGGRERATVAELSGGEAQRAAVAQILLLSPQLLVGDEFVSGLDPGMSAWILDQCRQNLDRSGGAALFALHDVQIALRISDRILIIWPPHIDRQPWQLQRNTPAWQGNVLYTTLCLARYAKDLPPSSSIRHLAKYLQTWLSSEPELQHFLTQHQDRIVLEVSEDGNLSPFIEENHGIFPANTLSNHWTDMTPIQIELSQGTFIGITIPRNDAPLTVVAKV